MTHNGPIELAQRKQQVSGVFDRAAATYDHVGPRFFSHFGRRLVELANIPSGSNVLDVATGRGALLYPAGESVGPQGHVVGIDMSAMMVQETTKELSRLNMPTTVEVRQMDAEHLQFPDNSFDYVLCGFALFFFPQLDLAMSEFRRVLKPNGHICVTTWGRLHEWKWFDEIVERCLPPDPEEDQGLKPISKPVFDTSEGLETIMSAAGFGDIRIVSEAAEFVYSTEDEFWSTLWSHGARETLERIELAMGPEGLEKFRLEVFRKVAEMKQTDGLHETFPVLVGLAIKPQD